MPATQFVVNYSLKTGRVRSFISFHEADEHDLHLDGVRVGLGEGQLRFPVKEPDHPEHVPGRPNLPSLEEIQAMVTIATGLTPTNDRHAIVDDHGNVVGAIHADPEGCGDGYDAAHAERVLGRKGSLRLVPHAHAGPGWRHDGKQISPPIAAE